MSDATLEQLVAYTLGELEGNELAQVESILKTDQDARDTVGRLQTALQTMRTDDSVPPPSHLSLWAKSLLNQKQASVLDWVQAAAHVIATLVYDSRTPGMLAGFRGGGADYHLAYENGQTTVDLQLSPGSTPGDPWTIRGQVEGTGASAATVALVDDDLQLVQQAAIDKNGYFRIKSNPGTYKVAVRVGDTGLLVPMVEVG